MELFVKMAVSAWDTYNNRLSKLVNDLSDNDLMLETAPGRNSGTYLLGHLVAVSDAMLPLMGWGERLYPELENVFLKNPDRSGLPKPTIAELKSYLAVVNDMLAAHINGMEYADWLARHTAVSEEDFAREPHRNKLNILLNRTNHLNYHLGQMAYLVKK